MDANRLKVQVNCRQPFALLPEELTSVQQGVPREETSAGCPLLTAMLRTKGLPFRETYTQQEVAIIFGKDPRTVRSWTANGRLAAYDLGGLRYFARDIENFIRASRRNSTNVMK